MTHTSPSTAISAADYACVRGGSAPARAVRALGLSTTEQVRHGMLVRSTGGFINVERASLEQRARDVLTIGKYLQAKALEAGLKRAVFGTLTFADRLAGGKRGEISAYIDAVRKYVVRVYGYDALGLWVAEPQWDGTIHYHFVIWIRHGHKIPKPDEVRGRYCQWRHGWSKVEQARSPIGYLAGYLAKGVKGGAAKIKTGRAQWALFRAKYPGSRTYGFFGASEEMREVLRWKRLPRYVRDLSTVVNCPRRASGGGWAFPNGDYLCAAFVCVSDRRVDALGREVDSGWIMWVLDPRWRYELEYDYERLEVVGRYVPSPAAWLRVGGCPF